MSLKAGSEGKYEGVGFVQFRTPLELQECLRAFPKRGREYPGRGEDHDGNWNKTIYLEVAPSTKEFDIQGIEVDWGVEWDHMTANPPRGGNMSVTAPRVCTHGELDCRDQIMEHTRD